MCRHAYWNPSWQGTQFLKCTLLTDYKESEYLAIDCMLTSICCTLLVLLQPQSVRVSVSALCCIESWIRMPNDHGQTQDGSWFDVGILILCLFQSDHFQHCWKANFTPVWSRGQNKLFQQNNQARLCPYKEHFYRWNWDIILCRSARQSWAPHQGILHSKILHNNILHTNTPRIYKAWW